MEVDIVPIGNSKGIRIPARILKQCGMDKRVKIEVNGNKITLSPSRAPRQGWAEACRRMHDRGDDELIIPNHLDNDLLEDCNDK